MFSDQLLLLTTHRLKVRHTQYYMIIYFIWLCVEKFFESLQASTVPEHLLEDGILLVNVTFSAQAIITLGMYLFGW